MVFLMAIGIVPTYAQNYSKSKIGTDSISGKVVNIITKKEVVGAKIQTINMASSAMTDDNGKFGLLYPISSRTLLISAPGYENKEIVLYPGEKDKTIGILPIGSDNYFDDKVNFLGARRKSSISTSIKTLNLNNNLNSNTVDRAIVNQLAGDINVTANSGAHSSGLFMLLRGINSINATNQPLIVIDGVIFDNRDSEKSIHLGNSFNPFSPVDVNDVQSISVVKDGTSIWGSKGGNGVILINTNRGRSQATQISVSTALGYNTQPTVIPMMNASQYRTYVNDILKNEDARNSISSQYFLNNNPDFVFYNQYHNNTNWADGIYRNSPVQSYNMSVNGGDEVALYNLSLGYSRALNTIKENDFSRINARFNSDIELIRNLKVSFDIAYSQVDRTMRNDGVTDGISSQINSPGFLSLIKSPFLNPYKYDNAKNITSNLEDYDFLNISNPYSVIDKGVGVSQQRNFSMSIVPQLKINKNLTLSSRLSYTDKNISENLFSPMYGVAPYFDLDNNFISDNYVKTQFLHQISIFNDSRLNWKMNSGIHSFELNTGLRLLNDAYQTESAFGHNTGSDQVKEISTSLKYKTVSGIDEPYKLVSYYGIINYSLMDKYFAEVATSAETSSRFGRQTNSGVQALGVSWAVFPSINAAWLVSSEKFMKNIKFIDQFKLRGGYGISGNDDIESTAARTYLGAIQYSGTATGIQINNLGNPAVQWETVTKRNVGFDASMLHSRLSITFDLYNNTTDNLLTLKDAPGYSGVGSYWVNDGKLENKGIELGFNATIVRQKDFSLSLGATVSHYENKILKLANGDYRTTLYRAEVLTAQNQPMGLFYGYETNGVYATVGAAQLDGLSVRTATNALLPLEAGDIRFVNKNNDKIIDENDKVVIGNPNPDLFGTFNLGVKYKDLGLRAIFNYSYGNDVYNYLRSQLESGSTFYNQTVAMNNRWLAEGQKTDIPKSEYGDPKANNRFSDRWIEDGSYLKFKTLELSYDMPVKNISFLQGITIWASFNNLWTLTKYLGMDPEFSSSNNIFYRGIDTGLLPQSRSYYAGVKINL